MHDRTLTMDQVDRAVRLVLRSDGFEFGDGRDWSDGEEIGRRAFREELARCDSALELHCVASNLNWDLGYDGLRAVLEHPRCDRGTALLLYWFGDPTYAPADPDAEWNREPAEFLAGIAERYLRGGFASSAIATDPACAFGEDRRFSGNAPVPEAMLAATPGTYAEDLSVCVRILAAIGWFDGGALTAANIAAYEVCLRGVRFPPGKSEELHLLLRRVGSTEGSAASVGALRAFLISMLTEGQ